MKKRNVGLIGSGWRAEFYIRIAKALPEEFHLTAVLIRDPQKGQAFAERFGVTVVNTLDELLQTGPDYVVLSVKRGFTVQYLEELFRRKVPVLCETPPGETTEELVSLWQTTEALQGKIQIAEQYPFQPLYAAWMEAIRKGLLGDVVNINISALHGYHGICIIRRMLGTGYENCRIYGKRYTFPITETHGRDGMVFDGEIVECSRDRVTLEFGNGRVAFFDFADPAQYHSFIRTRQLSVQGTRGEIDDLSIRYLTEANLPVTAELHRIDLGVYNNQEWAHFGIMLGEEFLYRNPFEHARLNDDEIAVAACMRGMGEYLDSGKEFYSLAEALQDMYLSLMMEQAMEQPYQQVQTADQIWKPECRQQGGEL